MPQKNPDKNKDMLKELEKTISPVLVVNNSSLKPYVELFDYSPENIYQQPLGSLVGFFEVKEYSQESAYIVNFLTSVLKKEYYINPKRPVTESLDSALHKVNMALSELAKQGNVEWLGKLHASICVLEKNNTHFSVAGNAKIFLYRNNMLSEISEDLASDSVDPHPLKTFVNVSSGRLEKDDRLLITSEDIFHILPSTELKKNFQRFEGDKFVQFLKTALSNQMEMIASVVIDMKEPEEVAEEKAVSRKKSNRAANVFSEKTFASSPASITSIEETLQAMHEEENEAEYTDQKTGHIYIQGEAGAPSENSQTHLYWEMTKEKVAEGWYLTKNDIRRRFSLYKKQLAKQRQLRKTEKEKRQKLQTEEEQRLREEQIIQEMEREQQLAQEKEQQQIRAELEARQREEEERIELENQTRQQSKVSAHEIATPQKAATETAEEIASSETLEPTVELSFKEKLALAMKEQQRSAVIDLRSPKKNIAKEEASVPEEDKSIEYEIEDDQKYEKEKHKLQPVVSLENFSAISSAKKTIAHSLAAAGEGASTLFDKIKKQKLPTENAKQIIPHYSKIKKLFASFSSKQKLSVLVALIAIFIVPIFIVQWMNKPKPHPITELEVLPPSPSEILSQDRNINLSASSNSLLSRTDLISTLITSAGPVAITNSGVVMLTSGQQKEYKIPDGNGNIVHATYMNDLALVLLLTDQNKIVSFSPVSFQFTSNNIKLEGVSSGSLIGTYLTYMYVLDAKANQIYRFPRATGGFADKTTWYKDTVSLASVSDMTIDDNIYAIESGQVLKFFKGKKVDFSLEVSNTPIHLDKLFTTPDLQSLYALDTQNSRLVTYAKDGKISAQYFNEALKTGTSLAVDEPNKTAYITTSSGLISVSLQ